MKLRVHLAQFYPKLGNIEYNMEKHIEISGRAKDKADLLIFPELSLTGSNLMDLVSEVALEKNSKILNPLLEFSSNLDIIFGLVELGENNLFYDSAFYCSKSSLKYVHRKSFLSSPRRSGGKDYFSSGNNTGVLNADWGKLGFIISDDALNPVSVLPFIQKNPDIIIIIDNGLSFGFSSDTGIPKSALMWKNLISLYAQIFCSYVIYVNRVGFEDGLNFFGGSSVIDPYGETIISCPYFEESLLDVELDLQTFKSRHFNLSFDRERLESIVGNLKDEI
ncbi:MAG TPA: nitrilase-related carbon-nitrogen hydrolase [bacterium]|nr:nitrilase-related carbon-nitrogen hydrolase [bacterium]